MWKYNMGVGDENGISRASVGGWVNVRVSRKTECNLLDKIKSEAAASVAAEWCCENFYKTIFFLFQFKILSYFPATCIKVFHHLLGYYYIPGVSLLSSSPASCYYYYYYLQYFHFPFAIVIVLLGMWKTRGKTDFHNIKSHLYNPSGGGNWK